MNNFRDVANDVQMKQKQRDNQNLEQLRRQKANLEKQLQEEKNPKIKGHISKHIQICNREIARLQLDR
jgi:hypothetical protein